MLEKLTGWVFGRLFNDVQASAADLAVAHTELTGANANIELASPSFEYNGKIPSSYTVDGAGISPPLEWRGVPAGAAAVVLLMEDADSPTPKPFVHTLVWDLPATDGMLPEGALNNHANDSDVTTTGRNSFMSKHYLPPAPPRGRGQHRYVFQIFALDTRLDFTLTPGRDAFLEALRGHVMAKGLLIGVYARE